MKIIKTSQAMPEAGEYVLAWLENTTTPMRAMWVAQFTLPVGEDADPEWGEYCEEKDEYFCPAGWYEMNRHEEQHWSVDGNVVAWCELPCLDQRCLAQIEEPAQPIAGYRISDPSDPTIKPWLSETPDDNGYTSEPLYAGAAPAAVAGSGWQAAADWLRNNYQEHPNIASLCDALVAAAPALEAPPAVAPQGEYPHEQMDAMALARYKVVPSHASMLWSHAVVAGDGAQQLYVGREVECQNMARKFAGAFLDGAFAFHSMAAAPTAQAAPALEAPAALLTKPALVGSCRFGVGVPERYVIDAAQRHHEQEGQREAMTAEQFADEERKRRTLWELIHGPLAAAPQAPAAPSGLPSGWVPCILTHDGQHPEEVAYGPQIMMDRLKKWLGRYFELLAQKVLAEPFHTEMLAALQAVAMDVVHVGAGENTITDAARAKVEAVLEKLGAPWPGPAAAPAAPSDAQLLSEWDRVSGITKATERRLACMRAVLQRWGSAAPAAPAADADPMTEFLRDPGPAIVWPKARDVGRIGDMSPSAHLRIGLDSDNDVYASIWDERGGATIEFCTPGQGGGKSSRTRMALLAVMVAMEADNAADPRRDWWAERNGAAQAAAKGASDHG